MYLRFEVTGWWHYFQVINRHVAYPTFNIRGNVDQCETKKFTPWHINADALFVTSPPFNIGHSVYRRIKCVYRLAYQHQWISSIIIVLCLGVGWVYVHPYEVMVKWFIATFAEMKKIQCRINLSPVKFPVIEVQLITILLPEEKFAFSKSYINTEKMVWTRESADEPSTYHVLIT